MQPGQKIDTVYAGALCNPQREHQSFTDPARALRSDIFVASPPNGGRPLALDLAVTTPLAAYHRENLPGAQRTEPLAAAKWYAASKRRKYADFVPDNIIFRPLIFESFGSMTDECRKTIGTAASAWGKRRNIPPHRAIPLVFQRISVTLQNSIAEYLVLDAEFPESLLPNAGEVPVSE